MNISELSKNQPIIAKNADSSVPTADEIDEMLENASPKIKVQKMLIDEMFGKDKAEKSDSDTKKVVVNDAAEPPQSPPPQDTVTISARALEMHRRERIEIEHRNGDEKVRFVYEREQSLRIEEQQATSADPLILDLNGNGIELTDLTRNEGVEFDITGDGKKEIVSWVSPNDAFLAYDRNGNGVIDNGNELFGDQHGAVDGFAELAKFDTDRNGLIDHNDTVFNDLLVWSDLNSDGSSDSQELRTLEEAGITSINLDAKSANEFIAGNQVTGYSSYESNDGMSKAIGEVFLNYIG